MTVSYGPERMTAMDKDDGPKEIADIIKGFGPWQVMLFLVSFFAGVPAGFYNLIVRLIAPPVDFWCARPEEFQNWTVAEWKNWSSPLEESKDGMRPSRCNMYVLNATDPPTINRDRTVACTHWEYDSSQYGATITEKWDLVCSQSYLISLSNSIYMCGFLSAMLIVVPLTDRFGRKPILMFTIVTMLIAGMACAFAPSVIAFIAFRYFLAFGRSSVLIIAYIILMEGVSPEYRPLLGILREIGEAIAKTILPGIVYGLRNWFYVQIIITAPFFGFLLFFWLVPESPRWLITQGRLEEAEKILKRAARMNKLDLPNLSEDLKKVASYIAKEEAAKLEKRATFLDLWRTPNIRKKTAIIYFLWFVFAYTNYGFSFNTNDLGGNIFLNFALGGIVEFPAIIGSFIAVKYCSRRKLYMAIHVIGGLFFLATIPVPSDLHWLLVTFAMIGKMFSAAGVAMLYLYSAELYPTVLRSTGMSSSSVVARIGAIIAPYNKELAQHSSLAVCYALFGSLCIAAGLLALLLPETKGKPLPETVEQAEAFGRVEKKKPPVLKVETSQPSYSNPVCDDAKF